jgi:hypothetical protein
MALRLLTASADTGSGFLLVKFFFLMRVLS